MPHTMVLSASSIRRDLVAGLVVFLVAIPLCLGIALASGAPLFAGIVAGIIGGLVVGSISGSHTSVSGPAAGLTAIVAAQIAGLRSFDTFLLAVVVAGLIQVGLGLARAGAISAFFPTSVIKGLLSAIGVILILKQIPHALGHDTDPEGEMAFVQPDHQNTFSELLASIGDVHPGAAAVGLVSLAVLMAWDRIGVLQRSPVPPPLVVVVLGVTLSSLFKAWGSPWVIQPSHLVQVPVAADLAGLAQFVRLPNFAQWANPAVYVAGLVLALVASLETLLNLQAVDKLDPRQRVSPPNRELVAQGVGNILAGLIGGIPVTSVVVRSSVNVQAGAQTKLAAIVHGGLLAGCGLLAPQVLNLIPLSCLAAVLLMTGAKLVSPKLIQQMWSDGPQQFLPFVVTIVAIVFTDLIQGVLIGMVVAVGFILHSNFRQPLRRIVERHLHGEVLRIELPNQVSFLNRASIERALNEVPRGGHVLLDATNTDYIDPDVLGLIREYRNIRGPARGVEVSLRGFRGHYRLADEIQYVEFATRELQRQLTPGQVVEILRAGNERFRTGHRLTRDHGRVMEATAGGQHPLAVVLSCVDSRAPAETVFDLGLGDILNVRIAGNVTSPKVLASLEYGCAVAGARLILVMGHTRCGAVTTAVEYACNPDETLRASGCQHLEDLVRDLTALIADDTCQSLPGLLPALRAEVVDDLARRNVWATVLSLTEQSDTLCRLARENRIGIIGAMYDVATGRVEFLDAATLVPSHPENS